MLSFAVMVLLSTLFSTYRILYTYIFIVIWNTTSSCDPASYCVAGMIVQPGSSGKVRFLRIFVRMCVYKTHFNYTTMYVNPSQKYAQVRVPVCHTRRSITVVFYQTKLIFNVLSYRYIDCGQHTVVHLEL